MLVTVTKALEPLGRFFYIVIGSFCRDCLGDDSPLILSAHSLTLSEEAYTFLIEILEPLGGGVGCRWSSDRNM